MSEILIAAAALMLVGGGVYIATRKTGGGLNIKRQDDAAPGDAGGFDLSRLFSGFASAPDTRPPSPGFSLGDLFGGTISLPGPTSSDPYAAYRNLSRDVDILARTLWGEARGETARGRHAVANVIMNRVSDRRWPNSAAAVCLQPWQFSMSKAGDPNRALAGAVTPEGSAIFRECVDLAKLAVAGDLPDITGGANHYHTKAVDPDWNRNMRRTAEIGAHIFMVG